MIYRISFFIFDPLFVHKEEKVKADTMDEASTIIMKKYKGSFSNIRKIYDN
jgi:hypothetical protein